MDEIMRENPMQDEINALREKCQKLQLERDRAVEAGDLAEQARQATFDQCRELRGQVDRLSGFAEGVGERVNQAETRLVQKLINILKSGQHTETFKSAVAEQLAQHLLVEKNHGAEINQMIAHVQTHLAQLGWDQSLNEDDLFKSVNGRLDDVRERLGTYYVVEN